MKIRRLSTIEEVVAAVGRDRLYQITGKGSQHVTNWAAAGFFPPVTYVVIQAELRRLNCRAPDRLWRMIELRQARAA